MYLQDLKVVKGIISQPNYDQTASVPARCYSESIQRDGSMYIKEKGVCKTCFKYV